VSGSGPGATGRSRRPQRSALRPGPTFAFCARGESLVANVRSYMPAYSVTGSTRRWAANAGELDLAIPTVNPGETLHTGDGRKLLVLDAA